DRNVPADDKAPLRQSVQDPGPQRCFSLGGAAAEIPNDGQGRLCRGRKRRKCGRAADQREKLAAVRHSMTSSAPARFAAESLKTVRRCIHSLLFFALGLSQPSLPAAL